MTSNSENYYVNYLKSYITQKKYIPNQDATMTESEKNESKTFNSNDNISSQKHVTKQQDNLFPQIQKLQIDNHSKTSHQYSQAFSISNSTINQALLQSSNDIQNLLADNRKLRQQIDDLTSKLNSYSSFQLEFDLLTKERDVLKEKLVKQRNENNELKAENKQLWKRLKEQDLELKEISQHAIELNYKSHTQESFGEAELGSLRGSLLMEQLSEKTHSLIECEEELAKLQNDNLRLSSENEMFQSSSQFTQARFQQLKSDIKDLKYQLEQRDKRVKEYQALLQNSSSFQIERQFKKLQDEHSILQLKCQKYMKQLHILKDECQQMENEKEAINEKLIELQDHSKNQRDLILELTLKKKKLELKTVEFDDIQLIAQKYNGMFYLKNSLKETFEDLAAKLFKLTKDNNQQIRTIKQFEEQFQIVSENNENYLNENQKLKSVLGELKTITKADNNDELKEHVELYKMNNEILNQIKLTIKTDQNLPQTISELQNDRDVLNSVKNKILFNEKTELFERINQLIENDSQINKLKKSIQFDTVDDIIVQIQLIKELYKTFDSNNQQELLQSCTNMINSMKNIIKILNCDFEESPKLIKKMKVFMKLGQKLTKDLKSLFPSNNNDELLNQIHSHHSILYKINEILALNDSDEILNQISIHSMFYKNIRSLFLLNASNDEILEKLKDDQNFFKSINQFVTFNNNDQLLMIIRDSLKYVSNIHNIINIEDNELSLKKIKENKELFDQLSNNLLHIDSSGEILMHIKQLKEFVSKLNSLFPSLTNFDEIYEIIKQNSFLTNSCNSIFCIHDTQNLINSIKTNKMFYDLIHNLSSKTFSEEERLKMIENAIKLQNHMKQLFPLNNDDDERFEIIKRNDNLLKEVTSIVLCNDSDNLISILKDYNNFFVQSEEIMHTKIKSDMLLKIQDMIKGIENLYDQLEISNTESTETNCNKISNELKEYRELDQQLSKIVNYENRNELIQKVTDILSENVRYNQMLDQLKETLQRHQDSDSKLQSSHSRFLNKLGQILNVDQNELNEESFIEIISNYHTILHDMKKSLNQPNINQFSNSIQQLQNELKQKSEEIQQHQILMTQKLKSIQKDDLIETATESQGIENSDKTDLILTEVQKLRENFEHEIEETKKKHTNFVNSIIRIINNKYSIKNETEIPAIIIKILKEKESYQNINEELVNELKQYLYFNDENDLISQIQFLTNLNEQFQKIKESNSSIANINDVNKLIKQLQTKLANMNHKYANFIKQIFTIINEKDESRIIETIQNINLYKNESCQYLKNENLNENIRRINGLIETEALLVNIAQYLNVSVNNVNQEIRKNAEMVKTQQVELSTEKLNNEKQKQEMQKIKDHQTHFLDSLASILEVSAKEKEIFKKVSELKSKHDIMKKLSGTLQLNNK